MHYDISCRDTDEVINSRNKTSKKVLHKPFFKVLSFTLNKLDFSNIASENIMTFVTTNIVTSIGYPLLKIVSSFFSNTKE